MPIPNRLILAKGEEYISPIVPGSGSGDKLYPRSYEEARGHVKGSLQRTLSELSEMPAKFKLRDEEVVTVRMNPDFTAKSYELSRVIKNDSGLTHVGSRSFVQPLAEIPKSQIKKHLKRSEADPRSRLIFLRGRHEALLELNRKLDSSENSLSDKFKEEVRSIEAISLLSPDEKIAAFRLEEDWKEGRVEVVLHPSRYGKDVQLDFFRQLILGGTDAEKNIRTAAYENGPTFISCWLTRNQLEELSHANPLRSAQPLRFHGLANVRSASSFPMPMLPPDVSRSSVTVGLFDGGINPNHPYLLGHATEDQALSIQTPPDAACVAHGTAVAGVLLYGELNGNGSGSSLSPPKVSVESFRVLPTSDPHDIDLYESIDVIENVVPQKPGIKFYNVSLGQPAQYLRIISLVSRMHLISWHIVMMSDSVSPSGMMVNKERSMGGFKHLQIW